MLTDDPLFWRSLRFTAKWVVVEVGLQLVLGMGLALLVNEPFRGRGLARALVFSPWAVSGVLTTGIWVLLYNPSTGIAHVPRRHGHRRPATPRALASRPRPSRPWSSPNCGAESRSSPF